MQVDRSKYKTATFRQAHTGVRFVQEQGLGGTYKKKQKLRNNNKLLYHTAAANYEQNLQHV